MHPCDHCDSGVALIVVVVALTYGPIHARIAETWCPLCVAREIPHHPSLSN